MESDKTALILDLKAIGCIRFGDFTLKSGAKSNYYIDLRYASMKPSLFKFMIKLVQAEIDENISPLPPFIISGVPYGVVPLAYGVAHECDRPYYPVRKEVKGYGSGPDTSVLDGEKSIVLIEDVMSSGSSIIETVQKLGPEKVIAVVVVVDREAGGAENIRKLYPNIKLVSVLKASDILKEADI